MSDAPGALTTAAAAGEGPALPLGRVALFGLGDWGPSTASTAVLFFLPFFLTDVARVPPSLAAVVILVGGVCDALSVPMVGALSDRVRSRWGRRRPFLAFGPVPFAAAFALLWVIPPVGPALKAAYFAAAYALFDAAFACVQVPYASLTPEIAEGERDRTRLNAARAVVSMVGGLVAAALVPACIGAFSDRPTGYRVTMAVLGCVGALPFWALFATVRERPAVAAPPDAHPLAEVRDVLRTPAVREAAGVYLVAWIAVSVVASMFEYYVTHVLSLRGKLEIVLGMVQCSALVSVPLVAWASGRFGLRKTLAAGALWWSLVLASLGFLPADRATVGYALALACGPGIAASHVVPWTLLADSVDADEGRSGRRREGAVYGVLGFAQKAGVAVSVAASQWGLGLAGYAAGAHVQTPAVKLVVRLLFAGVPAVMLVTLAAVAYGRRASDKARA